ncbi:cytochrome P450 [Antrihabitans stalactiti]|uniref:Cytochrome P450 n=1 Tax=Antrihabitans stalactiti TaxID=2584121 RepID=A0A848KGS2_9NOCA|nr:cytochrome P450 [Antrihabitans stalactiti]NMN97479.1 cytochrome P450 [Antrihabitans stalactiti]
MSARTVDVPPGPSLPRFVQGVAFIASRRKTMQYLRNRYGPTFTIDIPLFGRSVVVTEPALIKQVFMTSTDVASNLRPNLGRVLGDGSIFNLEGEAHRRQRKLLVPPFHGKRMHAYESVIEEEFLREAASWPGNKEFATLDSMMHITLNAILRAVFGAEGAEFEALRKLLPGWVKFASRLATVPIPRKDLGPWSPWGRFNGYRREFDAIVGSLIDKALADPHLAERDDVLAMLLQSRYDDGSAMSHRDVADELITLLAAGHETTATTLAWAIERLQRHPDLLARLVAEVDEGGSELRQATILEVQRTRPVIDLMGRHVISESMPLGDWTIPRGYTVIVGISIVHDDESVFPNADQFDPDRFVGHKPNNYEWVPFGGGTRRCPGAAFANMEMDVVLRTLLRDFDLTTTHAPGERFHSRGVAYAPKNGGRVRLRRRNTLSNNVVTPLRRAESLPSA